jgi:pimeloyl-ACP methyl ester carboxylesterase
MAKIKLRDLVVVLPGICGSVLQKDGRDLWAVSGQAIFSGLLSLGGALQQLRLGNDDPTVDDLGDGIKATSIFQDFHMMPGLVKIDGYTAFRNLFTQEFEVVQGDLNSDKPANYFEFAYDWRRDNRVAARQLQRLVETRLPQWREFSGAANARVILVAHSMGGLVSRHYLEVLGGWRDCRTLITFGTPFRGSLNALSFLANGYKQLFIDLTEVMRSFTATYQLLPIYEVLTTDTQDAVRVAEVDGIPGVQRQRAADALEFHNEIQRAVEANRKNAEYLTNGYELLPVVGTHQPTLQSALFTNGKLTASRARPKGVPEFLADGDGTVPWVSAIPIELSDRPRGVFAAEKHASLQRNTAMLEQLFQRIKQLQAPDLGALKGFEPMLDLQARGLLSLEVDDVYTQEEPVQIRGRLLNAQEDPGAIIVRIKPLAAGKRTRRYTLHPMDGEWSRSVNTLPPGTYRVEVTTEQQGMGAPLPVHDVFEVAG